jgi:hypothetical protein
MITYSLLLLAAAPVVTTDGATISVAPIVEAAPASVDTQSNLRKSADIETGVTGKDYAQTSVQKKKGRMITILGIVATVLGASLAL